MLTSTLCTLAFFARTAIASSTPAKPKVIPSHDGIAYKIQMTENDLERVKGIPIVMDFDGEIFEPVDIEASMVKQIFQIWTTLLKEKEQKGHDAISDDVCDTKGIVHPYGEIQEQFERVAVWRGKDAGTDALLVIREISPNLYEWMYIDTSCQSRCAFWTYKFYELELRFVYDQIGERYFTEISSVFAQQRIHQLQGDIASGAGGHAELKIIQKHLDEHVEKLRVDILDHQESDKNAAIQRETQDGILREEKNLRAAVSKECTHWKSEVDKMGAEKAETERKHQEEILQIKQQKADELRKKEDIFVAQLNEQQEAAVEAEQKFREKEEGIDHWIMISMFIGGGILVVIGFIIFQLARRTYNEMYDDMEYELNAQLKRVKEPHPLVPEYPSAHANRLGVHEHPAVRDVFGMKEPWDVTPGEGFHVSRITKGGDTPGTSRGKVDDETAGVPVMEGMSEGDVMEHDKEQMVESAENFDI